MKLALSLLATTATGAWGFSIAPSAPSVATSTALFASRRRQKIASRTQWLEARGADMGEAAVAGTLEKPGLMTNAGGLEYVKLVDESTGASSEVYLYGGCVTSYKDADGTEFIAVRPDAKMDGSKPISGGLSHWYDTLWPVPGSYCSSLFDHVNHLRDLVISNV